MWTLCSQDMAQNESGTRELGSLRPSAVAAQQSESDKVCFQDVTPFCLSLHNTYHIEYRSNLQHVTSLDGLTVLLSVWSFCQSLRGPRRGEICR